MPLRIRRRPLVQAALTVLASAALALAPAAASAREKEPIRFVYDAPQACPTEAALVAGIAELGGAFQADPGIETGRKFSISIESTATGGFEGTLTVKDALGDETVRSAAGATCEEVTGSLSLFMTLALEDLPALPPAVQATPAPEGFLFPLAPSNDAVKHGSTTRGGIALATFAGVAGSSGLQTTLGIHAMAATPVGDHGRIGVSGAFSEDASDSGFMGRFGALFSAGAPWNDGVVGFAGEVGAHISRLTGFPAWTSCSGAGSCFYENGASTFTGPPARYTSVAPYVAASLILQIPIRSMRVRWFAGHTVVWSTDYLNASSLLLTVNMGFAWQAW